MDVGNVCSLLASCRTLLFPQRLLLGHFLSGQRPHDFVWGRIGKKSFICLRGGDVPEGWAEEEALAGAEKELGHRSVTLPRLPEEGGSRCVWEVIAGGFFPPLARSPGQVSSRLAWGSAVYGSADPASPCPLVLPWRRGPRGTPTSHHSAEPPDREPP